MHPKIRIAVLYGGKSSEHEVSIQSAHNIINNLDSNLFDITPIGIDLSGKWWLGTEVYEKSLVEKLVSPSAQTNKLPLSSADLINAEVNPEVINYSHNNTGVEAFFPPSPMLNFDVIFPVVHGTWCEDGSLQGLLQSIGYAYVGCGILASALSMDKDFAKRIATQIGIPSGKYLVLKIDRWEANQNYYVQQIQDQIKFPLFVKPANTGSSVGMSKIKQHSQLKDAINFAFQFDTKVLIEQALNVIELEIAVLENLPPKVEPIISKVGEVKPHSKYEYYSYDAKYLDQEGADLIIPANISEDQIAQAQAIASKLFNAFDCEGMCRVDLFLNKADDKIYFNEINTIPGFTQISMYPRLMQASGYSYSNFLTHLITLAINRKKNREKLIFHYRPSII